MKRIDRLKPPRRAVLAGAVCVMLSCAGGDSPFPYEEILRRNAEEMNKKCPMPAGEGIRLDSTSAGPGRRFTYCYSLTRQTLDSMDVNALQAELKPILIDNLKNNRDIGLLRKNKVNMYYRFFDRKHRFVVTIPILPGEYAR